MNTVFPQIYSIIDKNPLKDTRINTALHRDVESTTAQGYETWDCFLCKPLQPSGPLSLLLSQFDPMYAMGTPALRKQIQSEKLLELQARVDTELIGRRWPRKKIQDHLASIVSTSGPTSAPLLEEVLCELFQVQKVSLVRKTKRIVFFPSDVRMWTSERTVVFGDDEGFWSYEPTNVDVSLIDWLQEKEQQGWKIQWPTADGKLEDLKTALTKRGLTAHVETGSDSTKVKKDDYARVLGRAEAISALHQLGLRIQ